MTDTMLRLSRLKRQQAGQQTREIEVDGVPVLCTYYVDGEYYPGNDIDPPEVPSVVLVRAEIGGVDVTDWDDAHQFTYWLEQALFNGGES